MALTPNKPQGQPIAAPTTAPMPQQTITPGANVASANDMVQGNPSFVAHSPAVAAAGISTGNQSAFNTLAATTHMVATANAVDDHVQTYNSGSWISNIFKDVKEIPTAVIKTITDLPVVGKAVGTAMTWANKPLQEAQRDYKFIHSLYADHGIIDGTIGSLGVLAGGAVGSLAGPEGTVIGAELGESLEKNVLGRALPAYKDSFNKSNDPNYLVSFGRDVANGLSKIPGLGVLKNTNAGIGQVVSGVADASFDFEADPLAIAGKLKSQVANGDNVAIALDEDKLDAAGKPTPKINPQTGKPIAVAALPWATSGQGLQNFLLSNSTVVHSADQLDSVLANPLNGKINRAIDDIVTKAQDPKTAVASITNDYGVINGWSRVMVKSLANVTNRQQVVQIFKEALYSKELADNSAGAIAELKMPSRTLGKAVSENWGLDRIRNSAQASTVNEQVNFLVPKRTLITDPVTGEQSYKVTKSLLTQKPNMDNVMNALAGKVRTFTGQRPLSMNMDDMSLSSKDIDFSDPNVGKTLYDIAYLALPHKVALERATDILTSTEEDQLAKLHTLNQEVLKGYGIADSQASSILGQAKDALAGNTIQNGVYGFNQGRSIGKVELQPEYGDSPKSMAVVIGQRYKGAMLDLKSLKTSLRQAKAYGAMYNKADDFFTNYTNTIFAPLALLSPAFGIRVSSGEALAQVMRRGLPSYLGNVLSTSLDKMARKYRAYHTDAIAEGLTQTDLDAIEAEQTKPKNWSEYYQKQIDRAMADKSPTMEQDIANYKDLMAKAIEEEKKPVKITENDVTKELDERSKTIADTWSKVSDAAASKENWNNAVNAARNAKFKIQPLGAAADAFSKSKLVPYFVKDKIKALDEYRQVMGTEPITAGVASAHSASQELYSKEQIDMFTKSIGHGSKPGQEMAGLTQFDPHMHDYWAKNVNMAAVDQGQRDIARDYLNNLKNPAFKALSPDDQFASLVDAQAARLKNPNMYKDYRSTMDGYSKAVPESFAKAQVDYLQGVVHGADGTIHTDLISKIAKGDSTTTGRDLRNLSDDSAPLKVLGRHNMPTISDSLRRAEEIGYRKFVNPVMDYISRQPLFADFYTRRRLTNQPLIDLGLIDKEEAVRMSALQATREMIPAIHSPAIRSQFAVLHRNLLPFYFAQEQALRRTGRLIMKYPQAFRDYQMVQQGLNNPGFVHTDANGQKYIVYPGLGEFGNSLVRGFNALGMQQFSGLPESITGNTSSLLTVLPDLKMPGTSPFINLGLSKLSNMFPWLDKAVNVASGGYPSQNIIDTIIPNSTMRDLWNAMSMDDRESTVYNSKLSAIAAAYYHGDLPENYTSLPPFQQAQILAKIENNAKSNLIVKGLLSFFLPLAPTVSNDYYTSAGQTLRSEYLNILNQKDPTTGQNYTAASALAKFMQETGSPTSPSRGLAYTIARSVSGTDGAYAPLADSTVSWIDNNQSLLNNSKYSSAAPYLIPQVADSKDALSVENKLLLDHFRAKATPQEFINSLYVKQGWQDLAQDYADYQSAMATARASNNRQQEYTIGQVWKQYTANYGQSNPVWYADYNNPTRNVESAKVIGQFQEMDKNGLLPNTPEGNGVKQLIQDYQYYHQGLIANTVNGQHLPNYSTLQDAWYTYLDNLAVSNPRLQSVITSVFRRAV